MRPAKMKITDLEAVEGSHGRSCQLLPPAVHGQTEAPHKPLQRPEPIVVAAPFSLSWQTPVVDLCWTPMGWSVVATGVDLSIEPSSRTWRASTSKVVQICKVINALHTSWYNIEYVYTFVCVCVSMCVINIYIIYIYINMCVYITLHYITLRYTILCHIIPYHVILYYIILHHITSDYIILHCITLFFTILHYNSITLCYIIIHYNSLYYISHVTL